MSHIPTSTFKSSHQQNPSNIILYVMPSCENYPQIRYMCWQFGIWADNYCLTTSEFFRQICFADFANSHRPCLSLYVYVYPFCVDLCCGVAIKNHILIRTFLVEWRKSRSSSHFKSQNCWHFIILSNISQMVRDRAHIAIVVRQEVRYQPSNGPSANIVQHNLDLWFKYHTISENHIIFIRWKTLRASGKCSSMFS